jgi:diacylglycerol kinase (ATP)
VVNGILQARNFPEQRITLALFPRGTGNDWGRYWGLKRNFRQAVEVYLKAKKQGIDIGKVEYRRNGELQKHYFVNSAGFGLDHKVVQETHRLKHFVGSHSFLYFIALVKAVFTFRPQALSVSTADMEYSGNVLTMNIGNGCYSGGGIRQNPDADPCDGLLDAMYITRLTFKDICRGVTKLFNGRLNELPFVNTIRCTEMQINGKGYLPFEADGIEVNAAAPYSISLIADAIDMIVP